MPFHTASTKKSGKGSYKGATFLSVKRRPRTSSLEDMAEEVEVEDEMLNQEFYPELLAVIINFLTSHKEGFIEGNKEVLDVFSDIASQSIFHISKECALQFLCEDAGIYAEREHLDFEEVFEFLQVILNGLYWDQMNHCLPTQAQRKDFGDANGMTTVNDIVHVVKQVENHPNLFQDQIAMYSYLPNILLESLWTDALRHDYTSKLKFEGVCMLADISGFTKLSGMCCEEGTAGLDRLHSACSGYLGKFIQTVYNFKGDVISFAGDALIVVFPLDRKDIPAAVPVAGEKAKSHMKAICCMRAVECAKILAGFYTNELTAHVGISYGEMSIAKLGGYNSEWVYLMNGACINAISSCVDNATSKQVVVTGTVFDNLFATSGQMPGRSTKQTDFLQEDGSEVHSITVGDRHMTVSSYKLTSGNYRIDEFSCTMGDVETAQAPLISRFDHFNSNALQLQCHAEQQISAVTLPSFGRMPSIGRAPSTLNLNSRSSKSGHFPGVSSMDLLYEDLSFDDAVKLFVPKPVLDAISFSSLETVSELREVTTMFLNLNSYDPVKNQDPESLQEFALMAQEQLAKTGGFLRQFLVDDKGCVLIAMWGVPSFSYPNNMERATACAIMLRGGTMALGHQCSIGVTSGTVYVGNIGSLVRRDFVGLGADVNLAARFMSKANGLIYVDQKAASQLPAQFRDALKISPGLALKGVKGLSYACVCTGDMSDFLYIDFVDSVCKKRKMDFGTADADATSKVLLPKYISDPIKNRLRKTQGRHVFLMKQKAELDAENDVVTNIGKDEKEKESLQEHAPSLGKIKRAQSKYSNTCMSIRGLQTGSGTVSPGLVQLTPQQAAKLRNKESQHKPHPVNFIICEGPVGTGKTMTVNLFTEFAQRCEINVASYSCVSGDVSVPLGVINKLIVMMLGTDLQNNERLSQLASRMHWDSHSDDSLAFKTALLRRAMGLQLKPRVESVLDNFNNDEINQLSFMGNASFSPEADNLFSVLDASSKSVNMDGEDDGLEGREDGSVGSIGSANSLAAGAAAAASAATSIVGVNVSTKTDSSAGVLSASGVCLFPESADRNNSAAIYGLAESATKNSTACSPSPTAKKETKNSKMSTVLSDTDSAVDSMLENLGISGPKVQRDPIAQAKFLLEQETDEVLPVHSDNEGILFHLLFVLLNEDLYALVIDSAQYCDDASWNVLLMISHLLANSVVMLALRSFHVDHGTHSPAYIGSMSGLNAEGDDHMLSKQISRVVSMKPPVMKGLSGALHMASPSISNNSDGVAKHNPLAWADFHGSMPPSCAQLLANPYTVHLELKPFTIDEVRVYMYKTLESHELVRNLPEELVQSVHDVSSGCPFWVKQIVSFINTRGEDIFLSTTADEVETPPPQNDAITPTGGRSDGGGSFSVQNMLSAGSRSQGQVVPTNDSATGIAMMSSPNSTRQAHAKKKKKNPLHQMIIVRLESMTQEAQTTLKYASIIGEEFNATLLESILPSVMKDVIVASLESLVQASLIFPDDDDTDLYSFANHLIHQIIYDLTPPTEANKLHRSIAHHIEALYLEPAKKSSNPRDLSACYRLLILHYSQHMASRPKTFKYLVLMCDECVHMQAYCDVAAYADRACTIANSRTELRVLLVVLNCVTNAIHAKNFSKLLTFTANSNIVINGINAVTKNVKAKINAINVAKGNTPVSKTGDNDERSKSMSRSISVAGGSVSLRRDFSKRLDWAADFRPDEGDKIIVDCSNCACTLS